MDVFLGGRQQAVNTDFVFGLFSNHVQRVLFGIGWVISYFSVGTLIGIRSNESGNNVMMVIT